MHKLPPISKKHMIRFFIYMAAYVISILIMASLKKDLHNDPIFVGLVALPAIFTFLALYESYKGVMAMDEMLRRIHLEGVFISACFTAGLTFTWSLFTNIGLPEFPSIMVLPLLLAGYGIGSGLRSRAYN
ncbi:hypothetical protein QGN29_07560 [Temperatibacter marinus]|uniref:Uncharacterized protein n=1 Tax=Temperatibacter marinus TaxID=1456591 RepID=A0AA52EE54_9PROT|nr:hypothetical protein [Temperatibacter marinus]WND01413.1 hypothetical protein QGN29_07560 [Temperatibacter marinus]